MVVHLCNDLMLVGKISAWARAHHVSYCNLSSLASLQQWLDEANDHRMSLLLVDLQIQPLDIPLLMELVRTERNGPSKTVILVGYAQHVMTDLLEAARSAEFDRVLTRGQFDRQFADIISGDMER